MVFHLPHCCASHLSLLLATTMRMAVLLAPNTKSGFSRTLLEFCRQWSWNALLPFLALLTNSHMSLMMVLAGKGICYISAWLITHSAFPHQWYLKVVSDIGMFWASCYLNLRIEFDKAKAGTSAKSTPKRMNTSKIFAPASPAFSKAAVLSTTIRKPSLRASETGMAIV